MSDPRVLLDTGPMVALFSEDDEHQALLLCLDGPDPASAHLLAGRTEIPVLPRSLPA